MKINTKVKKIIFIIILLLIFIIVGIVIAISTTKSKEVNSNSETENIVNTGNSNEKKVSTMIIRDNYFATTLNDMFLNYNQYKGKQLSYEGFIYYDESNNNTMIVARYYYCCGTDSYIVGMECEYDGEKPEKEQWVKVTGIIEINDKNPKEIYPYLKVTSLELKDEKGNMYVNN